MTYSEDTELTLVHNFNINSKVSHDFTILQYVACIYETKWWIGTILEIENKLYASPCMVLDGHFIGCEWMGYHYSFIVFY